MLQQKYRNLYFLSRTHQIKCTGQDSLVSQMVDGGQGHGLSLTEMTVVPFGSILNVTISQSVPCSGFQQRMIFPS